MITHDPDLDPALTPNHPALEISAVGPTQPHRTLVDEYLPVYDVSDGVAAVVQADVATTWDALMDVDLIDVGRRRPLIGFLGAIRILPDIVSHLVHGELPQRAPEHVRLRDITTFPVDKGGWVLLGERSG